MNGDEYRQENRKSDAAIDAQRAHWCRCGHDPGHHGQPDTRGASLRGCDFGCDCGPCEPVTPESPEAKRARYRTWLQVAHPELAALLREEFRVSCRHYGLGGACAAPAVVVLTWSDRELETCAQHIPDTVVGIALDHCGDRSDIRPDVAVVHPHWLAVESGASDPEPTRVWEARIELVCAAARAHLDAVRPGWRGKSVDLSDAECAEMLRRCREAYAA